MSNEYGERTIGRIVTVCRIEQGVGNVVVGQYFNVGNDNCRDGKIQAWMIDGPWFRASSKGAKDEIIKRYEASILSMADKINAHRESTGRPTYETDQVMLDGAELACRTMTGALQGCYAHLTGRLATDAVELMIENVKRALDNYGGGAQ